MTVRLPMGKKRIAFFLRSFPGWIFIFSILLVPLGFDQFFSADDDDYFATASAIAFLNYPDFSYEYVYPSYENIKFPFAAPGSGILAAPFVFLGSLVDRILANPIVEIRTLDNRSFSFSLLGFQISTYTYMLIAWSLLFKFLRKKFSFATSQAVCILLVFCSGILYFVFSRPVMSHVYEFFSVILLIMFLDRLASTDKCRIRDYIELGLVLGLVALVRYNNLILAILVIIFLFYKVKNPNGYKSKSHDNKVSMVNAITTFTVFIMVFLTFRLLPSLKSGFNSDDLTYAGSLSTKTNKLSTIPLQQHAEHFFSVIARPDMGILFTSTPVFVGTILFMIYWRRLPTYMKFMSLSILSNLAITVLWGSYGGSYTYRYFLYSTAPIVALPLAHFIQSLERNRHHYTTRLIVFLMGFIPIISLLSYSTKQEFSQSSYVDLAGHVQYQASNTMHTDMIVDFLKKPYWVLGYRIYFSILGIFNRTQVQLLQLGSQEQVYSLIRTLLYLFVTLPFVFGISNSGRIKIVNLFNSGLRRNTE